MHNSILLEAGKVNGNNSYFIPEYHRPCLRASIHTIYADTSRQGQ